MRSSLVQSCSVSVYRSLSGDNQSSSSIAAPWRRLASLVWCWNIRLCISGTSERGDVLAGCLSVRWSDVQQDRRFINLFSCLNWRQTWFWLWTNPPSDGPLQKNLIYLVSGSKNWAQQIWKTRTRSIYQTTRQYQTFSGTSWDLHQQFSCFSGDITPLMTSQGHQQLKTSWCFTWTKIFFFF